MTGKVIGVVVAAVVGMLMVCVVGAAVMLGGTTSCSPPPPSGGPAGTVPAGGWAAVDRCNRDQVALAATIVSVGSQTGVPVRGWVIAVATAIQESSHHQSHRRRPGLHRPVPAAAQPRLGHPRPTPRPCLRRRQLLPPTPHRPRLATPPLTDAAQAVQHSAYPDAYAKWENDATSLVHQLAVLNASAAPVALDGCSNPCQQETAAIGDPGSLAAASTPPCQWVTPVDAPIVSEFRTAQRPQHQGVDLGAARGTPIRAASAGVVTVVRCNITPASHGRDRDGSPATPGCGWYVQIRHDHDILTRYCHMLRQPDVAIGQHVIARQILGYVGTSGHSSGAHLHFEVHLNNDTTPNGAIDPIAFMATRAPLGQTPRTPR